MAGPPPRDRVLLAWPAATAHLLIPALESAGFAFPDQAGSPNEVKVLAATGSYALIVVDSDLAAGALDDLVLWLQRVRPDVPVVVSCPPDAVPDASPLASSRVHVLGRSSSAPPALTAHVAAELIPRAVHVARSRPEAAPRDVTSPDRPLDLVAIGASTGGPDALEVLFSSLAAPLPCPVLVVQHMPSSFTPLLAERLSRRSSMVVTEATDGQVPRPGHAYVAPGDRHLELGPSGVLRVLDSPPVNSIRPSVDVLFTSIARVGWAPRTLAVLLTGMGSDGTDGAARLVDAGGWVLCQDEGSSVVWGMPGAAAAAGLPYAVLPLTSIEAEISRRVKRPS